jgi:DNA invertase Pin-like site-specific DNA recombinase
MGLPVSRPKEDFMNNRQRVGIYACVSTSDQSAEDQIRDLHRYARERRWHVMGTYVDHGLSGVFGESTGPG